MSAKLATSPDTIGLIQTFNLNPSLPRLRLMKEKTKATLSNNSREDVKLEDFNNNSTTAGAAKLNLSQDSVEKLTSYTQNSSGGGGVIEVSGGGTGNSSGPATRKQRRANYVPIAEKIKNSIG